MPTLLSYGVVPTPSPLQTSTRGNLRIIASNRNRQDRVVVKSLQIVLSVGENQFDLTNAAGSIVVGIAAGWNVGQDGGKYLLSRNVPDVVDSLEINLSNINVNAIPGETAVRIYEIARFSDETEWSDEERFEQLILKESQLLRINSLNAAPKRIRGGEATVLTWDASSTATLKLKFDKDGNGDKEIDVTKNGGTLRVDGITALGNVHFDLTAFLRGESVSRRATIEVMQPLPQILSFSGVRRDGALYLTWRTQFAKECTVSGKQGFLPAAAHDVRIDDAKAFIRLIAYNNQGESVTRDLFEYVADGEVRSPKPLAEGWTPRLGCSMDGGTIFFNRNDGTRQRFFIGATAEFPKAKQETPGEFASVNRDGSRSAVVTGERVYVMSPGMNIALPPVSPLRGDYAPFDWSLIVSGRGFIDYFDPTSLNRTGTRVQKGPVLSISRDRVYFDEPPDGISCVYQNAQGSFVVRFGSRIAAVAVDDREMVYVALPESNEVALFDGRNPDRGIQTRIKVGRTPTSLGITFNELVVANSGDPFLSVIDLASLRVVDTIPMPEPMCAVVTMPAFGLIFTYTSARDRVIRFRASMRTSVAPAARFAPAIAIRETQQPPSAGELPGIDIEHFVAVPEDVPMFGRATVAWSVSGPSAASARFILDAPDANEVEPRGLHQFTVTSPEMTVALNIFLDVDGNTLSTRREIVFRARS